MIVAFQLPSIRFYDCEVCDLDHMKMFAARPADLSSLPDLGWPSRPIRNTLAYVGVVSRCPPFPDWQKTR